MYILNVNSLGSHVHSIGHMVVLHFSNLLCVCMVICNINAFALQHIPCTKVLL